MNTKLVTSAHKLPKAQIILSAWITRWRMILVLLSFAGLSLTFLNHHTPLITCVVIASSLVLVSIFGQLFILFHGIPRRITHFQRTSFANVVYLHGLESCIPQQEIVEYEGVLQLMEEELGLPVEPHTLVIHDGSVPVPLGHRSSRFKCMFIEFVPAPTLEEQAEWDIAFQQALASYLHVTRKLWYMIMPPVHSFDHWLLAHALFYYRKAQHSTNVYLPAVTHRHLESSSYREAMFIRKGGSHDLAIVLLLAFVGQRMGLKTMVQSCLRARRSEYVSRSFLSEMFGGIENLWQAWQSHLDSLAAIADTSKYETIKTLSDLLDRVLKHGEMKPQQILDACHRAIERYPNATDVLFLSLKCAIAARDRQLAISVVERLKPIATSPCFKEWLALAEMLLMYLAGRLERNALDGLLASIEQDRLRNILLRLSRGGFRPNDSWEALRDLFIFAQ